MKNRHHLKWQVAALAATVGILACETLHAQQASPLKLEPAATNPAATQESRPAGSETGNAAPQFLSNPSISMGGNSLEVVGMDQATNATMALGQKLKLRIQFYNGGKTPVLVFALPYFNGKWPAGSKSKPSRRYKGGGEVEQWFYFDQPALVDEIQVTMVDANTKDTILTLSLPVEMIWGKRELRQSSSATNGAPKY